MTFSILADIGSVISGIGALFASIAALATVREMKKQREDSIRPEIVLSEEKYSIEYSESDDLPIFISERKGLDIPIYIMMKNIGVGPAKKIDMKWDFNFQNCVELLYCKGEYYRYLKNHNEKQFETKKHGYFTVEDLDSYSISILGEKKEIEIRLPSSYVQILSIMINEFYMSQEIRNLPNLELNLKYFDSHWNELVDKVTIIPLLRDIYRKEVEGEVKYKSDLQFRIKDKYSPTS
ncbi:hypothetical protein AS034_05270 [[Bacillus] enclensis]|uniref:Uncharacterized protein n=1 Tax=[Bacillus] enclensis TaxID=1402860 RepID=A0A0V8HLV4_9BACI|nr:hypothetical protein [[Bacillus] enclensis]KSU63659.1 hypothetical protein AS034_05270 [[Bacillus] enclensis]SCB87648.1 hypothetical protein GA0061094_1099 [[Bacillus] enclensis]